MDVPSFRYHPDPVRSGSIQQSDATCDCCGQQRGAIYTGPVYSEKDVTALCPWCISDGSAHSRFEATFVDEAAIDDAVPKKVVTEITQRTPGYCTWQSEEWPACCDDAAAFLMPAGIAEIRANYYELEGSLMSHIVHELEMSGGAARKMLEAIHRDHGPTAYVFRCVQCESLHVRMDMP
jgi:uncharacterized protein CbrC (UPF0167 family)